MSDTTQHRGDRFALWLGPPVVIGCMAWLARWTGGDGGGSAFPAALTTLLSAAALAGAWLLAAFGYGSALTRSSGGTGASSGALSVAVGVAVLLVLDAAAGALGLLTTGGLGTWGLLIIGWALLAWSLATDLHRGASRPAPPPWLAWTAAPAVAVLLLAAASAPGWLWSTEFGGYDALSYHLQLPKEWLHLARMRPLEHNVYSALPGYVEAAYLHLAAMRGSALDAAYACQLLHAAFTLLTALITGRLAWSISTSRLAGAAAGATVLATPWTIIVGSLAYNGMATALLLAGGLLAIAEHERNSHARLWRAGAIVGLLAAAACGAKLTAAGLVAAPLIIIAALTVPLRRWPGLLISTFAAGAITLSPYLLRNAIHLGNPVFPFLPGVFGEAHWPAEQFAAWTAGHRADGGPIARIAALWNQFLRFGVGENPAPGEPWRWQWALTPWLGTIGLIAPLALLRSHRSWAGRLLLVLLVQVLFWLAFTHLQSRFLLPAVVPLATGVGLLIAAVQRRLPDAATPPRIVPAAAAVLLLAMSIVSVAIYRSERAGAPAAMVGSTDLFTGRGLPPDDQRRLALHASPVIFINTQLPRDAHVLLIGDARPFHYGREIRYATVWDRGLLARLMAAHPDAPDAWIAGLRARGITHVLIDVAMLARWERSGWLDPNLAPPRITTFAERRLQRMHHWPEVGVTLYRIPPPSR